MFYTLSYFWFISDGHWKLPNSQYKFTLKFNMVLHLNFFLTFGYDNHVFYYDDISGAHIHREEQNLAPKSPQKHAISTLKYQKKIWRGPLPLPRLPCGDEDTPPHTHPLSEFGASTRLSRHSTLLHCNSWIRLWKQQPSELDDAIFKRVSVCLKNIRVPTATEKYIEPVAGSVLRR